MCFSFPIKIQNKTSHKFRGIQTSQKYYQQEKNIQTTSFIINHHLINPSRMEGQSQNLQSFYPYQILSEFEKKAKCNIENGVQKKLMACVIGHKVGNELIGEELIFPKQTSPYSHVTESKEELLGK